MSSRKFIVVALALAGALCAGVAQAQESDDVRWSVTIGSPVGVRGYREPVPAYMYDRYQRPTRWDRDGDGIPNRRDRLYNPRWDRDGDGIPNRRDRYDNRRG